MKTKFSELLATSILGFGLFMFTRYCKFLPSIHLMILIAPIFILRFTRLLPKGKAVLYTLVGFLLSFNIALWGLFEFESKTLGIVFNIMRSSMLAIFWFIPFTVDRLVYPKFKNHKIFSTLTFPIVITSLFYLLTLDGPYDDGSGTTNSFGYIYESLAFSQIRSVFGIWVLIFIHSWLNSIINYCWEHKFKWNKIKNLVIIYLSLICAIFIFGFAKMNLKSSEKVETVNIASAVLTPKDGKPVLMAEFFVSQETSPYEETIIRIKNMVEEAASNDAKIISFQEFAIVIYEEDQGKLKNNLQQIAQGNQIYLSLSYAYYTKEEKGENVQLLIDPEGNIQLEYAKRYLFGMGPYGETSVFRKGAEVIQYHDTPYGRIGLSICRDAGFAKYMRQAAKANVDIMLSPSYDWPRSYSAWYLTAPIENGFSFVRPTYNGYSYAADYNGKVINHMEMENTETGILYSNVPTKGISTTYGKIGDVFGWLSSLALLFLVLPAKWRRLNR